MESYQPRVVRNEPPWGKSPPVQNSLSRPTGEGRGEGFPQLPQPDCFSRITLAKPTHRHDHNVMDSRRATHVLVFFPGQHSYDPKPVINSQFLDQYQLSRNRFLVIK